MKKLLCISLIVLLHLTRAFGVAVMSVDLGSEWMKVAIVSPGVPMEIALNGDSQRKTPVVVSFRDGERMFGEAAASVGVRFPSKVYQYSLDLLGKSLDHPLVADYLVKYPYYKLEAVQGPNGSFVFVHPEGKLKLTPEEIMAMMLRHARNIATNAAGQPVKEAVITVPPYFGQAERQALQSAAQLANINLLQLINSNTAAALNYGVFRRKDFNESTPSIILFFDMGAGSTVATIAAYQLVKSKDRGYTETNPQLTIKGVGFDRTMGGLEIQLRLREHLAKLFKEQTGLDATSSPRSMAKLLKEAGRLKKVLSANAEHIAQVENLMEEKDFRATITRTQLEDLIPDYAARIQAVVQAALKSAGLTLEEVEQVVLAGSSTRVPHVQQALQTATGRSDLSKSLNTDEAAAMGAAYQAAHLSKGFKVKTFLVRDLNLYPIQVEFSREMDGTGEIKAFKRLLFPHGNPYPQKKVMTFRSHVKDFDLQVNYADLDFLPEQDVKRLGSTNLMNLAITGVAEALAKHSEDESKGVKAYFRLDESGLINFEHAEAQFEKTVQEEEAEGDLESAFAKLGNTIGKLFSGGSSSQDEPAPTAEPPVEENQQKEEETSTPSPQNESTTASPASSSQKEEAAKSNDTQGDRPVKVVTLKEPLKDQKAKLDFMGLSQDELKASAKKLDELDEKDQAKLAHEQAKNSLEAFLLDMKDKLSSKEYEVAITPEDKDSLMAKLGATSDWLEYDSDEATTEELKEKRKELKTMARPMLERVREHRERPEALSTLNTMLNMSNTFLNGARGLEDPVFTEVELSTLEKLIKDTEEWRAKNVKEQKSQPLHKTPVFTLRDVAEKVGNLDREVKYLLNKARTAPKKPKKETEVPAKEEEKKEEDTKKKEEELAKEEEIKEEKVKKAEEETQEETLQLEGGEEKPEQPTKTVDPAEASSHSEL